MQGISAAHPPFRIVALGASNLTRGFHTIVSTARSAWGPEVQILAALGHGRSYGAASTVGFRTLPGILQSGLWQTLEGSDAVPTRALVTDIGNDILYGYAPEQILVWVNEVLKRLEQITHDISITNLPLESIRRLSPAKFLLFRSLLFPACRLSLAQTEERITQLNAGLARLAEAHGMRFFRLNPAWYGFDPIHIRPSLWRSAWQEILDAPSGDNKDAGSRLEALKIYFLAPERRSLFGFERITPQSGARLRNGARIWLY